MYLKSLYLHNFRLYKEKFYEFSPFVNMMVGPNAAGKTTILEAIHYLASGTSFRTHQALNLTHKDASNFYLEVRFVKHDIEHCLKMSYSPKDRKIFVNATRYPSLSSLIGLLLSVVFSPNDIDLVKGPPQVRRHFLDSQLSQADPLYLYHLNRYNRAMRQRNCLLKAKNLSSIYSWEHEMALSAAYLFEKRLALVDELQNSCRSLYEHIGGEKAALGLTYRPSGKLEIQKKEWFQQYLELFEKQRLREIFMACTLLGPQKDDFSLSVGDLEMRHFASEGQMRSCAATLRLSEWEGLYAATGEKPLMLLDDVETSLDKNRAKRLLQQARQLGQVFITSTQMSEYLILGSQDKILTIEA